MRVAQGATLIARYAYDVLGRRIAKRVYSAATGGTVGFTRFVYHGGQVAFETDSAGSTIGTRYVWGPGTDNLVAFRTTAAATDHYYVATDKLGSVHQIIKRDGTWVRTYGYTPYGSVAANAGSGVTLRYRWTGREWDAETGWYFHRARYYDPGQRRFVQEDPAGVAGGENLYAYVGGQALVLRDPSGQWAEGGPPQPFQDPCPGFDTCYEHGIEIDGVFVKGWNTEMVSSESLKRVNGQYVQACDEYRDNSAFMGSVSATWDATAAANQDQGPLVDNAEAGFWTGTDFTPLEEPRIGTGATWNSPPPSGAQTPATGTVDAWQPAPPPDGTWFFHGHPGGDPTFSPGDLDTFRRGRYDPWGRPHRASGGVVAVTRTHFALVAAGTGPSGTRNATCRR